MKQLLRRDLLWSRWFIHYIFCCLFFTAIHSTVHLSQVNGEFRELQQNEKTFLDNISSEKVPIKPENNVVPSLSNESLDNDVVTEEYLVKNDEVSLLFGWVQTPGAQSSKESPSIQVSMNNNFRGWIGFGINNKPRVNGASVIILHFKERSKRDKTGFQVQQFRILRRNIYEIVDGPMEVNVLEANVNQNYTRFAFQASEISGRIVADSRYLLYAFGTKGLTLDTSGDGWTIETLIPFRTPVASEEELSSYEALCAKADTTEAKAKARRALCTELGFYCFVDKKSRCRVHLNFYDNSAVPFNKNTCAKYNQYRDKTERQLRCEEEPGCTTKRKRGQPMCVTNLK